MRKQNTFASNPYCCVLQYRVVLYGYRIFARVYVYASTYILEDKTLVGVVLASGVRQASRTRLVRSCSSLQSHTSLQPGWTV